VLVCTHCNSQSVVYDQEYVTGTGWISRPRCLKCGRGKFANIDNSKQGEKVMAYLRCKHDGCDKGGAIQGYCNNHFAEKYGITASQYKAEKRGRSEDPLEVAGRVLDKASEKRKLEKEVNGHPYTGGLKNHKGGNIEVPEKGNQEPIPLIQLFLYPELLDRLTKAAKAEWRTPEGQAAWLIDKALQEKADDTYQSGSGRRGG